MADRRPFRFRLPWQSKARASRPTAEPQPHRPTTEIQAPAQAIAAIPIQQPPFQPPGIAPAQPPPPPPAQAPQRTESQPQSPPHATTEPQQAMQPTSPSIATTQTHSSSVPPSPSEGVSQPVSQTRNAFQTESPSNAGRQSRAASVPPSPSQIAAESQAAVKTAPQPQSPSHLVSQHAGQISSQTSSPPRSPVRLQPTSSQPPSPSETLQATNQETSQTTLSASQQEEPKLQMSLPPPQVQLLKTEITSEQASESEKEHIQVPGPVAAVAPTSASTLEATAISQKSNANITGDDAPMPHTELEKDMKEIEPSPSKTLQTTNQETFQTALSASEQEEQKLQTSLLPQQVHPLKTEITSEPASESEKEHIQVPGPVTAAAPTSASTLEATAISQKSNANITGDNAPMPHTKPEKDMKEIEKGEKFVQEQQTKGKTNSSAHEESTRSTKPKLLAASSVSGTHAKEAPSSAFDDEQKKHVKDNTSDGKKKITISSNGEKVKAVSSNHPKARSRASEPHQKPPMSNGKQVTRHKGIREDISKFINKLRVGQPVSISTLAGENRGALMHIGSESARKDGSIHIHRGYKFNPDESTEATSDVDESSKKSFKDPLTKEDWKTRAFVNTNTQGINNSILSQASVEERNPGVHLILAHKLAETTKHSTWTEPLETHKAEFNITSSDKLKYEPKIRRRCLRGLFLESSDTDNPEKPRRHGCRYSCATKSKDADIGVL